MVKANYTMPTMALALAFLIGCFGGLRSMTAPAVTAWASYLGWLKLDSPLTLIGAIPSVVVFTLLAVGELILDKHPKIPNRTEPLGIIGRIFGGGLSGACVAQSGGQNPIAGAILGAIGGVIGCFGGFLARRYCVKTRGMNGTVVALIEDAIAVGGCLWIVSRF